MDPFTQRLLEKAEQRSRILGVSNAAASKFPLRSNEVSSNSNADALRGACAKTMAVASQQIIDQLELSTSSEENFKMLQVIEKDSNEKNDKDLPQKVLRQFSAVDKENMDMGIEISILTDKNVEVQVQVEEEEHDNEYKTNEHKVKQQLLDTPVANIRDTSRNRLQRLGALYSNKDLLSSPIHRTEGQFHAEEAEIKLEKQQRLPQQRLGKLAALANTINQWEDDTSHRIVGGHNISEVSRHSNESPAKSDMSKKTKVEQNQLKSKHIEVKHLKWDPKVLNSLEAQGFQRRESSTVKVSYEFPEKTKTDKKAENIDKKAVAENLKPNNIISVASNPATELKSSEIEKKSNIIKTGLVSGRAAMFETQSSKKQNQELKLQKDPTELSLKERMKLFEKNKGEALIPKAAFGMAPSINKILQDSNNRKDDKNKASYETVRLDSTNSSTASASAPIVRTAVDNKLREKVNALVNAASENKGKEDLKRQREEDLQVLANRYNKQKVMNNKHQKETIPVPPPPPPPLLPQTQQTADTAVLSSKKRSPVAVVGDDNKRPRKFNNDAQQRLYPTLSDFESNESCESENDNCCTTATVSAISTSDEIRNAVPFLNDKHCNQAIDDDNDDSDVETDDEKSSSDICNVSFGREILHVVQKNDKPTTSKPRVVTYAEKDQIIVDDACNTSINSSEASMGVDDYLEEAFEEKVNDSDNDCSQDEVDASRISRDIKGTTTSNSFSFYKTSGPSYSGYKLIDGKTSEFQHTAQTAIDNNINATINSSNLTSPLKSELSVNKDSDFVTLVHTVSFYRKQQNSDSASSTPIRKICREQRVLRSELDKLDSQRFSATAVEDEKNWLDSEEEKQSNSEVNDNNLVQDKIRKLLDEVCKQQQVIAQTSQALNLCAATIEFSGSTESVEGERHLLVATHRRQACLDEVQRLRVEKTLRPIGASTERGRLSVAEITIPLRQDYIRKLSSDAISGHHLVCLLKYNEHVLATKTVPTLPGLLAVKFPDILQLNNVYTDFRVTLEIYGMTAHREVLPHEVKYHINLNKKSGIRTPKKKGSDNRLVMPPVQSPAGPHAIRTPALVQYGYAIFSLREIQRTTWSLTQVLGVSPLEGVVHMKINCELSITVEYKGFLTMFEDISGLGAWHRRWCHLNGTLINYWKYPDDEKSKAPIGTIDLYTCSSQHVNIAPRDICARLNTILLECQRPFKDTDKESLIIVPNGRMTTVRYLLSADTKQEREEWCAYLNKSLTLLRVWAPPQ